MVDKQIMKNKSGHINIRRILGMLFLGLLIFVIGIIIFLAKFQDGYSEQKFKREVAIIPGISAKIRNTFEGATLADIQIPNKGTLTVIYGFSGLEYITHIDKFDTTFICPEDQGIGIGFSLTKNSKFKKWFDFEVNNLKDLVKHYDDIVDGLNKLPHSPDPDYTIMMKNYRGKSVTCSIYR